MFCLSRALSPSDMFDRRTNKDHVTAITFEQSSSPPCAISFIRCQVSSPKEGITPEQFDGHVDVLVQELGWADKEVSSFTENCP